MFHDSFPSASTLLSGTRLRRRVALLGVGALCALVLAGCAVPGSNSGAASEASAGKPSPEVISELAPSGTLRAAINYGNPILATRDANGDLHGISVDFARELGRRLGVPVQFVPYTAARKVVEGAKAQAWDVGFVGIDADRAKDMLYTAPYVIIEGVYMVPVNSPIMRNDQVDQKGTRIAVSGGSAYDLFLTRQLKNATLIRSSDPSHVTELMLQQSLAVVAGVKQRNEVDAKRFGGLRLLDGHFMVIRQAMATLKNRPEAAAYLSRFVEEMKATGGVQQALDRNHIEGASVAPPAGASE